MEYFQMVGMCLHKSGEAGVVPCPVKDPAVVNSVVWETAHPLQQLSGMQFWITQRIQPWI